MNKCFYRVPPPPPRSHNVFKDVVAQGASRKFNHGPLTWFSALNLILILIYSLFIECY